MQNYRIYTLKESNQDQEIFDIITKSLQYQDLNILKRIFNVTIESVDEATELIKVDILQDDHIEDLIEEDNGLGDNDPDLYKDVIDQMYDDALTDYNYFNDIDPDPHLID